jgi:hypothetical protein
LGISIALDGARYPHISYIGDNRDLRYVYADAGGWHTQTVYSEGEPAIFTSLALDGSGRPHIVFHHREFWIEGWYTADLRYAYMDAAGWRLQTVATAGWTSRYVSLAVDGAGHPHIGYNFVLRDESANRVRRWLRYAERDEAGWRLQTVFRDSVDSSMYHEEALSLVLDDGDRVHLAYISTTFNPTLLTPGLHDDLKYAHEASLGWDVHTVAGNAGSSCSIVLDGAGYPHISYYGDGVLTYAYGSAAGWHREVVTSDAYRDCSLALDSSGYPHISYCSGAYPDQDLRYTYRDAGGWHVQTVDSLGSVGTDCSLTLDRSDRPHISYYAAPGHDLKYAHEGQAGWCVEIVDSLGSVGRFTSLAMDGGDKAHIAYHDATNDDLKYAYQGPSGWNVLTVDAVGPAGGYCSLALDESGRAHIAYYASVDCIPVGDLRYARAEFISNGSELASWAGMIRLVSVAPNPFVTSTELRWEQGSPGLVEAAVFDLLGRKVAAVAEGEAEQGEKRLTWRPVGLQSGVYVLRVSVDGSTAAVQPLIYRR